MESMSEYAAYGPLAGGARALRGRYDEVCCSPDGQWLACWSPESRDADRRVGLDVRDRMTGETVWALSALPAVDAVAWAAPEVLLVRRGGALVAHELPDGGAVAAAAVAGERRGALQVSRDRRRAYIEVTDFGRPRAVVLSLPELDVIAEFRPDEVLRRAMDEGWRTRVDDLRGVMDPEGTRVAFAVAQDDRPESDVRLAVVDVRSAASVAERAVVARGLPPRSRMHLRWLSRTELLAAPGVESGARPARVTLHETPPGASVRRFVEAPVLLPGARVPAVRALDVDLSGERALLTWEVFPQMRFQLVDRVRANAVTVAVDPRREWEEVARLDPHHDDAMLVARMLGEALRVERVPFAGGEATTLYEHPGSTARAVLRFDLLAQGGALVKLEDFPGSSAWLLLDASVQGGR